MADSAHFSKKVSRMLGLSLDSWNNALLMFLALGAFVAALVGVATYATIRLTKDESAESKREFEAYRLDSNLRAAGLEKEAADARLQTEQIKQVVSWRILQPDIAERFKKALGASPGRVNLRFTDGDAESLFFAIQLSKILEAANWQVAGGSEKTNSIMFGINLPDPATDDMVKLRAAFSAANIPFSTQEPLNTGTSLAFNVATIPGAPILRVGSKAPVVLP
jgi:hypothetical protein